MEFIKIGITETAPVSDPWVGVVALALCPLVQYGSQLIVEPEYRNPNYDFPMLFANVVWGNTQMFFPISLVMIGSC